MKTTILASLAVLALAATAGAATAQQAGPARALRGDADRDGRISRAEFVDRRVQRLTAADADRDGSVTREEMRAVAQAHRTERTSTRFDRLDADRDGVLSRAEFDGARRAGGDRGSRMRGHARHGGKAGHGPVVIADVQARTEQGFARLDADSDGFVTREERRAGMRQARDARRAAHQGATRPLASE